MEQEPRINPQVQGLLDAAREAALDPVFTLPVDQARQRMRDAFVSSNPPEDVLKVDELNVPGPLGGITCRLYRPHGGSLPVLLFIHGGGWVLNDLDTHDAVCRRLANQSGAAVVSVDYRRAPEFPYPAGLNDCYAVLSWLVDNGSSLSLNSSRLCVMGDSSGGTYATSLALLARDRGLKAQIALQVLVYPVTDAPDLDRDSYRDRGTGYSLGTEFMQWFWSHYIDDQDLELDDPYLCPLRTPSLVGMPPALVLTAEFDPLRDEGIAYVRKLTEAGVHVDHWHAEDQMHGFIMVTAVVDRARVLLDQIGDTIRDSLSGGN